MLDSVIQMLGDPGTVETQSVLSEYSIKPLNQVGLCTMDDPHLSKCPKHRLDHEVEGSK